MRDYQRQTETTTSHQLTGRKKTDRQIKYINFQDAQ